MRFDLKFILSLVGGIPGIIKLGVQYVKANVVTGDTVDKAADRMMTISEHDHRAACAALGIKDEQTISEGLAIGRIAGDKLGDYEAWFIKHQQRV